jgi:carbonic anhydrase
MTDLESLFANNKLATYWVRNIRDVYFNQQETLDAIKGDDQRIDRLCELNVIQQVANVSHTSIVQNAWKLGQDLTIHGWIYNIKNGLLRKLVDPVHCIEQVDESYRMI